MCMKESYRCTVTRARAVHERRVTSIIAITSRSTPDLRPITMFVLGDAELELPRHGENRVPSPRTPATVHRTVRSHET